MGTSNKRFILRKTRTKTYTITAIKNFNSPEFVEILTGFCEDLMYRTADSLNFKPTVWLLENDKHFGERYFVDDKGKKHYLKDFEKIGNGDPYSTADVIMVEAIAHELGLHVERTAQSQMLLGHPVEYSYRYAYEFWTEW